MTSARVGRSLVTIEASIWVAVITGFDCSPARRISRFWVAGTSSIGSSMPRSPRATMIPLVAAATMRLGLLGGLRLLDLGDQRDVGVALGESLDHRLEVLGRADERDGEQVDLVVDREVDPAQVVGAGGRHARAAARQVDALVGGDATARLDHAADLLAVDLERAQAHPAVGQEDRIALVHCRGEAVPADREQFARADRALRRRQGELLAGLDLDEPTLDLVEPQLRAGEVAEHADPFAHQLSGRPDPLDVLGVAGLVSVGEVEPEDVGSGRDQTLQHLRRPRGRADRGDDLRPAVIGHQSTSVGSSPGSASPLPPPPRRRREKRGPWVASGSTSPAGVVPAASSSGISSRWM